VARRFRTTRDGLVVSLAEAEIGLLRRLPDELRALLESGGGDGDPVMTRLFPRAYLDPTEEAAEAEWQDLVHSELLQERLAALDLVTTCLERATAKRNRYEVVLTEDEVHAWLGVLNDLRLALGTRLAITEDTDLGAFDPDDPAAPAAAIYGWLTWFQGEMVETLLG